MPFFVILSPDRPDALDDRIANRQDHIAYWEGKPGVVKVAGAMLADGAPSGSLLLIEAHDETEARSLLAGDPFTSNGVFAGGATLIEIRPAIGQWLPAA